VEEDVTKQHDKPCAECPFSRAVEPGGTGGSDPTVYVGQAFGPFWLPCHMDAKYKKDHLDTASLQCAGAAAFRENVGVAKYLPDELLHTRGDVDRVFATPQELIAHHLGIPLEEAENILKDTPPVELLKLEFRKVEEKQRAGERVLIRKAKGRE
jgi:hypothetical protein